MDSGKYITVKRIFFLQERCLEHMLPLVADRFDFIQECIELIINRNINEESLTEGDKEKLSIIHTFLNDAVSNLIVSLKLALYGTYIESLSLLRIALEPITVMTYKIEKRKFNENVNFNKAKQGIRARTEIQKLYDDLSNQIVHLDDETRRFRRFKLDGKTYPTIGMAIDLDRTKLVLGKLAPAALYLVRVLSDCYNTNTKREVVGEEYFGKVKDLEKAYRLLSKDTG